MQSWHDRATRTQIYKYIGIILAMGAEFLIGNVSSWPYHKKLGGIAKDVTNEGGEKT